MTVVSYSQNGEDVVLGRAFQHASAGFYVDVGASDPVVDSVTKHFYDRGWAGVNVEPAIVALEKLRIARPLDINLGVALGAKEGSATFYELPTSMTGCSTFSSDIAETYRRDGWAPKEREVQITTLARICEEHVDERGIDFLKVDVEGAELDVLAGGDFERFRPRVLVIEATRPGTPTPAYSEWEPLVLGSGYKLALFDGLNRFYVREEDAALVKTVAVPANYFDDYISYRYAAWRDESEKALYIAQQAETRAQASDAREQEANIREQEALQALAEQGERLQSAELALGQTRQRLAHSQSALRDAHTELAASRRALSSALDVRTSGAG